ncbi:Bcr/CflA family multidrug efflux MFS transporter [Hymenobacter metallicola]|uniref:Bcr/CflA family multidrug efflux MFS transporter n=1 Tax=Hymenobacter metallicola TaxID=2563114 RepID=A0A4Z0QGK0_9BACT|nr:Bcr/CflA family multidrug efflux MFS transporter [Hymenobacter metallicola]TGE28459.1 Bcr/CflA family multidrug efflux MFS transporter [Hymenobacter metallicola]
MRKPLTGHTSLILLLGLLTAFGPMSIDMYLPAFPAIAREFGVPISAVQFTLASYNIGIALGQLLYGPLADQLGRKPNLLAGMLLYGVAAVGCAFATSVDGLVAVRFMQAVGGCAGMVLARAIVRDRFDGNESAKVFSTLMLIMGVAPILAPTVGGLIIAHFDWRYIFGLLAVLAAITLIFIVLVLPETLPAERRNPVAVRNSFRTYAALLRDKEFVGYALTAGMVQGGMFTYITGSSFVFMKLFGLSEQQFGILFGLNAAGIITASQVNNLLLKRFTFQQILRAVTVFYFGAALVLLLMASTGWLGIYGIAVPLFCTVGCVGLAVPNATAGAMMHHGKQAGSASALMGTLMYSCGALAAISVSVLANNTALPMAATITACSAASVLIFRTMVGNHKVKAQQVAA